MLWAIKGFKGTKIDEMSTERYFEKKLNENFP
jgi:hypothetical protein